MAYDVSAHPRLSAKAQQLVTKNNALFLDEQAHAVELLKLEADTAYTATQLESVNRAIAFQINWQLEIPEAAKYKKQESSAASRSNITYRDGIPLVNPDAIATLPPVVAAGLWGSITSVRRAVV